MEIKEFIESFKNNMINEEDIREPSKELHEQRLDLTFSYMQTVLEE